MFYQMVGRGTRLDMTTDKLMFRLYDYTNATRLFGKSFLSKLAPKGGGGDSPPPEPPLTIVVEGFEVQIVAEGRSVLTMVDGQTMPMAVEDYEAQLTERLLNLVTTSIEFRSRWVLPEARRGLLAQLLESGRSPRIVQLLRKMEDYDLYDVLGELGYELKPKTRLIRFTEFVRQQAVWLGEMPPATAMTIQAIAQQFVVSGTDGLEDQRLFQVPEIARAGGLNALKLLGKPKEILQETKIKLFEV